MNIGKYSNFLFDLDGTLIDSFGDIKLSLESAYQTILNRSVFVSRNQIGPPIIEMIEELTPGLDEDYKLAIVKEFRNSYDNSSYGLTKEMEGSVKLLSQLFNLNKQLFLVTNKAYKPTLRILEKINIIFFKEIFSPDKFEGKKLSKSELIHYLIESHSLDPTKTVMIGDTRHDVIAAQANQLDSISVSDGYDSIENIKKENPTFIVKNITQLQSKIQQL